MIAIAPAFAETTPEPTPLHGALEELRRTYAESMIDPWTGFEPTLDAVTRLQDLGLPQEQYAPYFRLALRMGMLDYFQDRHNRRSAGAADHEASYAVGELDDALRAVPWPPGWPEEEAALPKRC